MTVIERAIESAKNRKYKLENDLSYEISDKHRKKAEGQKEVMQVTIEALEKQIPKKPIQISPKRHPYFVCPKCMEQISTNQPYCDECGQALKWGDEDE